MDNLFYTLTAAKQSYANLSMKISSTKSFILKTRLHIQAHLFFLCLDGLGVVTVKFFSDLHFTDMLLTFQNLYISHIFSIFRRPEFSDTLS